MEIDQQEVAALERKVGDQAQSPLFAKLAYLYLESGRAKDALRICDAGLANFPFYSTGHLIKGKTLLQLGMNGEARREFEFVQNWLPTNPTVQGLLDAVPQSDDIVLDAPPGDDTVREGSFTAEGSDLTSEAAAGSDFFEAAATEASPGTYSETAAAPDESSNVFGLPSEVPLTETPVEEGPGTWESAETTTPEMGAFEQFGQQQTGAPAEDDFESYAQRKRGELGETDVTTLSDYLSSPEAVAAPTREEPAQDQAFGGEEPLQAAGHGGSDFSSADEQTVAEASAADAVSEANGDPFAAAGFPMTEQMSAGAPDEEGTESAHVFDGFEEAETGSEPTPEPETTTEPSGMDAFGFGGETTDQAGTDMTPEAPVLEETSSDSSAVDAFGFGEATSDVPDEVQPDSSSVDDEAGGDVFTGFVGPGAEDETEPPSETSASVTEETEVPSFPDFGGLTSDDEATDEQTPHPETEVSAEVEAGGFSGPPAEEPAAPAPKEDRIGEFAEKLQDAKKITPVIDLTAQFSSSAASADEVAADAGFVTPTLAEIYAKQGWFDDAINAYKTLAKSRPAEKEKFEARVKALQEEKAKAE